MQIIHLNDNPLHHAEVSFFANSFLMYHDNDVCIPVSYFLPGFLRLLKPGDDMLLDQIHIEMICPNQVFNLPHVKYIFCDVGLSFFLCNQHHLGRLFIMSSSVLRSFLVGLPVPGSRLTKKPSFTLSLFSSSMEVRSSAKSLTILAGWRCSVKASTL